MECIILAGGLGTRLAGVIGDIPKCMAPVAGVPFLQYILDYLEHHHCTRVVLSLGYRHEAVLEYLNKRAFTFAVDWVVEQEPMGTGGGIRKALLKTAGEHVAVLNGDTLFQADLAALKAWHEQTRAAATLALKPMNNPDRYGTVTMDAQQRITAFAEKQAGIAEGLINGGVYILSREAFLNTPLPEKFSFEREYLEAHVRDGQFYGMVDAGYFIDIGVPHDYDRAQEDFKQQ